MANTIKKKRNQYFKDKEDYEKRKGAYDQKFEEYSEKTLEELKELFENKATRPGGIYKAAMLEVCRIKLEERNKKDKIDGVGTEESSSNSEEQANNTIQQGESPQ
jgi:hypothetical protein